MELVETILYSSLLMWQGNRLTIIGPSTGEIFFISLTVHSWKSTMNSTSEFSLKQQLPSVLHMHFYPDVD